MYCPKCKSTVLAQNLRTETNRDGSIRRRYQCRVSSCEHKFSTIERPLFNTTARGRVDPLYLKNIAFVYWGRADSFLVATSKKNPDLELLGELHRIADRIAAEWKGDPDPDHTSSIIGITDLGVIPEGMDLPDACEIVTP